MTKSTTTVLLDDEILDEIRIYSEMDNSNISNFMCKLLRTGLNQYILQQSGGCTINLPNPQFYHTKKDEVGELLNKLIEIDKLSMIYNIPLGLHNIYNFTRQRVFVDPESVRDTFRNNLTRDNK